MIHDSCLESGTACFVIRLAKKRGKRRESHGNLGSALAFTALDSGRPCGNSICLPSARLRGGLLVQTLEQFSACPREKISRYERAFGLGDRLQNLRV